MNILKTTMLCVAVGTALYAVADAPVAVRVEIESLAVEADGTRVALTVHVSPEDRSRIGKNAMVRIALDGDAPPGQSPLWAVRIERDGSGRIETVWPPGEHALRVDVASPSGEHTGLWVGTVRIPGATAETVGSDDRAEPLEPAPVPTPVPVPTPAAEIDDTAAAAAAAVMAPVPDVPAVVEQPVEITEALDEAPPDMAPSEVEEVATPDIAPPEVEEMAAAVQAPEPEPEAAIPVEDEIVTVAVPESPEITQETVPVVEVVEEAEPDLDEATPEAIAGAIAVAAATVPEATAETIPEPAAPTDRESPNVPDQEVEPEAAVIEPLRADATPPSPGPDSAAAPAPDKAVESAQPPPAEVAGAFEEWANADPATSDLTVVVFRGNEPATGLTAADFRVRIDGKDAVVEAVGDADRAPLQLGVAVDVASGSAAGWSQSGGRLFSLVQRVGGGRGHVFFAADGRVGAWDSGPGDARGGTAAVSSGGLTSLIVDALGRFEGRRGRAFLVVVTDGRSDADKAAWKAATNAAARAGVPVLVIALWDNNFNDRIRRNLKTIGESSGGGLFLVQGSDQLDRAADRFGPMIDAGVALRLLLPPGVTLPAQVSVEATEKTLEVTAPKSLR
ncbi:MAG: hypothetical protein MUP13_04260 [Thermoanaerobaculales bacterium]|nr:hypothetical protein [Thermoanaerobaculales bacterium]